METEGCLLAGSMIRVFPPEDAACIRRRRLPEVYRWPVPRKVLGERPLVLGGVDGDPSCANLNIRDRYRGWNPAYEGVFLVSGLANGNSKIIRLHRTSAN